MQARAGKARGGVVSVLTVVLVAGWACGQDAVGPFDPASKPAPTPAKPRPKSSPAKVAKADPAEDSKAERIDRMIEYFLGLYGKHLTSGDWIKRSMAVISLGRIDDARATEKLLSVVKSDRNAVVRIFAWESLHARAPSLTGPQRQRWQAAGVKLATGGAFRGQLRTGLVGVMGSMPPTPATRRAFVGLFENTNLQEAKDIPTLVAMRAALAKWRDASLVKALIRQMDDINNAYRAEYVLGGLNSGVQRAVRLRSNGSQVMWSETKQAWERWFAQAGLTTASADELVAYRGRSLLLPAPKKLTDPRDPQLHKDLELGRLHLRQLDVTFVIDSTGSMTSVIKWIKRDVMKMMLAFGMIAREPRIGITFFRDHGDAYLTQMHPLTGDAAALARAIGSASARGGGENDIPEAVYEALLATLKGQRWSGGSRACRAVVLVGDAEPRPHTMKQIEKLVKAYADKGFRFYCAKARTRWGSKDLSSFDKIASWGNGKSFDVSFRSSVRVGRYSRTSRGPDQIVSEVLKAILTQNYHDRADAFVRVLLEYVDTPVPEKRYAFGPIIPRPPRTTVRRPTRPTKPYDPQRR